MSEIAVFPGASSEEEVPSNQPNAPFDEVAAYYQWENGVRVAVASEQQKWAARPGIYDKALLSKVEPWEDTRFDEMERRQLWTGAQIIDMNKKRRVFSRAAILLASSHDHARFFDDVKCDYLGDSKRLGQFREISPHSNHTPFTDVQFNYDKGVLNAYADDTIIHVRETLHPEATSLSQKLFIVAINLTAMEVQRLYADDTPLIESHGNPQMTFDEIIPLTAQSLRGMESHFHVDDDNLLKPFVEELFKNQAIAMQPQLVRSAHDGWRYKAEGYAPYNKLQSIARLDEERGTLWSLGLSLGHVVTDRGAILPKHTQQELNS